MRTPTTRSAFKIRLNIFDLFWAALSPGVALFLRDATIFDTRFDEVPTFWALTFALALFAFVIFRIRDGFTPYFSVHDAIGVAKAVVMTELLTTLALFTITRLEGIPRSTPIIHGLILAGGLVFARIVFRLYRQDRENVGRETPAIQEHVIFVGATKLTALFIQILEACSPKRTIVLGVLDSNPEWLNQNIANVRVIGAPQQLDALIEEFGEHGMRTDRVIVGADSLPPEAARDINEICNRHEISVSYISQLLGLSFDEPASIAEAAPPAFTPSVFTVPFYFTIRRFVDPVIAFLLLLILSPLFVSVAILVLVDVGSPVLYWQHRLGRRRRMFLIHKFRTLKPMFDETGGQITTSERSSFIGDFLRRTRLDELPQLLNVLVGDMALIGPRPLLPHDQPENAHNRLMIKPGITGWAQVNGGKLLTAADKNAFDEWYVRNASFWLDVKIIIMTIGVIFHRNAEHRPQTRSRLCAGD